MLPISYYYPETRSDAGINQIDLGEFDPSIYVSRDKSRESEDIGNEPEQFAEPLDVSITLDDGTFFELPDGRVIWKLKLICEGALSMNFRFSEFVSEEETQVWIYDANGSAIRGPMSADCKDEKGYLWTPIVPGNETIIEVDFQAHNSTDKVNLATVFLGYDSAFTPIGPDTHQVDVICKQGNRWRDQIRSVATFIIQGKYRGTGTLLNNTKNDFEPYFLTAYHIRKAESSAGSMILHWNYDADKCGSRTDGTTAEYQCGADHIAENDESDFMLLKLKDKPDPKHNVFYSGWDATGNKPRDVTGIHHPKGRVKSICASSSEVLTTAYRSDEYERNTSYWRVEKWDWGRTECKSSGSGLWCNDGKLLIGQLRGGPRGCLGSNGPNWYGKLSVSWDGDGDSEDKKHKRLRDWLDPLNSGKRCSGKQPPTSPKEYFTFRDAKVEREKVEIASFVNTTVVKRLSKRSTTINGKIKKEGREQTIFNPPKQEKILNNVSLEAPLQIREAVESLNFRDDIINTLTLLIEKRVPETYEIREEVIHYLEKAEDWRSIQEILKPYTI